MDEILDHLETMVATILRYLHRRIESYAFRTLVRSEGQAQDL